MKRFTIIAIMLLLASTVWSQPKITATFITSPQLSWLATDSKEVSQQGSRFGFGYGVETDFYFGENYALNTGLTVSSLGGKLNYHPGSNFNFAGESLPSGTRIDYRMTHLEVPVTLKMISRDFHRVRLFAQFGFTHWFNIKAKASSSDGTFFLESVKEEVRFYNLGLNVGGGMMYDLGGKNYLTGGIVYSNGFMDATSNRDIKDDVLLKAFRMRIGFVF